MTGGNVQMGFQVDGIISHDSTFHFDGLKSRIVGLFLSRRLLPVK